MVYQHFYPPIDKEYYVTVLGCPELIGCEQFRKTILTKREERMEQYLGSHGRYFERESESSTETGSE